MDKLTKLLRKLDQKERAHLGTALSALLSGKAASLDIKKLKGVDNVYRIRTGNLRIIFMKEKGDVQILDISRRGDNTYRDF